MFRDFRHESNTQIVDLSSRHAIHTEAYRSSCCSEPLRDRREQLNGKSSDHMKENCIRYNICQISHTAL